MRLFNFYSNNRETIGILTTATTSNSTASSKEFPHAVRVRVAFLSKSFFHKLFTDVFIEVAASCG